MVVCSECGRDDFNGQRGLQIHVGKAHKELSTERKQAIIEGVQGNDVPANDDIHDQPASPDTTDQNDIDMPMEPSTSGVDCSFCGRKFKDSRGLNRHMPSCNPVAANNNRLQQHHLQSTVNSGTNQLTHDNNLPEVLSLDCNKWLSIFTGIANNLSGFDYSYFDQQFTQFVDFLFKANQSLPGPLHPNVKFYRWRKKKKDREVRANGTSQAQSSNPQRTDKRMRQKRHEQYEFELTQYLYANQRSKAVRKVMDSGQTTGQCPIPIVDLEHHFRNILDCPNEARLEDYPCPSLNEDIVVTIEEVHNAIRSINLSTSPGYDRVLSRTIRELKLGTTFKAILEVMLATGTVPNCLTRGKTILIHKGEDPKKASNWRPITIYSVIRRMFEKVLDVALRKQLKLNGNQRGFMNGTSGCHVNANLVNACLQDAKNRSTDCVVVFLDISKAFDHIGHTHIEQCLYSQGISHNLSRLIMSLLQGNNICIDTGKVKSDPIRVNRSVPQGGPLSPILFNTAINFIYQELCDNDFANQYGYKLYSDLDALCLTGFADDQVITSCSVEGARRIVQLTQTLFQRIGLEINPKKSVCINVVNGVLTPGTLDFGEGVLIRCIEQEEKIKYLGCSFNNELTWDNKVVGEITAKLNHLYSSPLLKREQKLNVINQYLLPILTYPLQAAPIHKIPKEDLRILDQSIRTTIKAIIGLPTATSTDMIYSPRKHRGLGVVKCEWEVFLQHFAISKKISNVQDEMIQRIKNWDNEMNICKSELKVEGSTSRELRTALRNESFERWAAKSYMGIGVQHYSTFPKSNRFMYEKHSLSNSEWVAALKLNVGYANLAGVPGTSEHASVDIRCRHCHNEKETPAHVLGACPFGENRRNARHHNIKYQLASLLEAKGYECFDEVTCLDGNQSIRRIDILAFDRNSSRAFLVDPTIRFETNQDMDMIVQEEKNGIYHSCIPFLAEKYSHFGERDFEVIGLFFGARGTIGRNVVQFFDRFELDKRVLPEMTESILIDSLNMIHLHIYASG